MVLIIGTRNSPYENVRKGMTRREISAALERIGANCDVAGNSVDIWLLAGDSRLIVEYGPVTEGKRGDGELIVQRKTLMWSPTTIERALGYLGMIDSRGVRS